MAWLSASLPMLSFKNSSILPTPPLFITPLTITVKRVCATKRNNFIVSLLFQQASWWNLWCWWEGSTTQWKCSHWLQTMMKAAPPWYIWVRVLLTTTLRSLMWLVKGSTAFMRYTPISHYRWGAGVTYRFLFAFQISRIFTKIAQIRAVLTQISTYSPNFST